MRAFAALLDRLVLTPQRNVKLRLMTDYFRATPDPDRGYALAALTGDLDIPSVKPAMLRALVTARVDEVLFAYSYDYVGDLAETIALIWPAGRRMLALLKRAGRGRRGMRLIASRHPRREPRRPCRGGTTGLAGPPHRPPRKGEGAAPSRRDRRAAAGGVADGGAAAGGGLARPARRLRPLGADQAGHRRPADRRLGAAGQAGGRRPRRPAGQRDRGGVARPRAALSRPLRLARGARTERRNPR